VASQVVDDIKAVRSALLDCATRTRRIVTSLPEAVQAIRRLPVIDVQISSGPAGDRLVRHLGRRHVGLTMYRAAAALALPADFEEYMRGRSRQAVRTNYSRARRLGVTSEIVTPEDLRRRVIEVRTSKAGLFAVDALLDGIGEADHEHWVVLDSRGATVGAAQILLDRSVACIKYLAAVGRDDHGARYALSVDIVRSLCERNYRTVLVDLPLGKGPGLLYFQHLVGFVPARLRVERVRGQIGSG
jgi:hypothetical protein